jgi:hypothetical protein
MNFRYNLAVKSIDDVILLELYTNRKENGKCLSIFGM